MLWHGPSIAFSGFEAALSAPVYGRMAWPLGPDPAGVARFRMRAPRSGWGTIRGMLWHGPSILFPKQFPVGVFSATLDLAALVLVGVVGFLGSEVVLSPVVSGCLPSYGGWVLVSVAAFLGSEMVVFLHVGGGSWLVWPHLEQNIP